MNIQAGVAQAVEQRIRNAWVGGSNPSTGTTDVFYCCISLTKLEGFFVHV